MSLSAPEDGKVEELTVKLMSDSSDHGEEAIYHLRGLCSESDVEIWSDFCQESFAYKANPPTSEYFRRHFFNDPMKDFNLVRVAICGHKIYDTSSPIVSSVRVFRRYISTGDGGKIRAGGIGEVCTSLSHRKRGLAKALLQNAVQIMSSDAESMECSLLHASPSLTMVYEKSASYVSVPSRFSLVRLKMESLSSGTSSHVECGHRDISFNVRLAKFPEDTEKLQSIHQVYSEKRFCGCIIRSTEYWNQYLSVEIGKSLFVLTYEKGESHLGDDVIVAWISIRRRDSFYQLRDFGMDTESLKKMGVCITTVMKVLLMHTFRQCNVDVDALQGELVLKIPTPILHDIQQSDETCSWIDWSRGIVTDDDFGWMYKTLSKPSSASIGREDSTNKRDMSYLVNILERPHLIWPADSF